MPTTLENEESESTSSIMNNSNNIKEEVDMQKNETTDKIVVINGQLGILKMETSSDKRKHLRRKINKVEMNIQKFFGELAIELEDMEGIDLTDEGEELIGKALCAFAPDVGEEQNNGYDEEENDSLDEESSLECTSSSSSSSESESESSLSLSESDEDEEKNDDKKRSRMIDSNDDDDDNDSSPKKQKDI